MIFFRLYKPVSDWLKMLPLDINWTLDINVTKRNYLFECERQFICSLLENYFFYLNLYRNNLALI